MRSTRRRPALLAAALAPVTILLSSCVAPAGAPAVGRAPAHASATTPARPPLAPVVRVPELHFDGARASQGALLRGRVTPADSTLTLDGRPVPLAADGSFIVAFDRDAAGEASLRAQNSAGAAEIPIAVAVFDWPIERVNARITGGAVTSDEFRARRAGELARIADARARVAAAAATGPAASDGWGQDFILPVEGRISGRFGRQRIYRGEPGSYHSGMDIAAPAGTPFVAPADGVVVLAATAPFTLEGLLLIVDHGMGLSSSFLHASRLDVAQGDRVRQGQPLGLVGATGRATGPHMHWGMRWGDSRIDPERVARDRRGE